jgi:hypothetical protein
MLGNRVGRILVASSLALGCVTGACSKGQEAHPPPAPAMPAGWTVKQDVEASRKQIAEVEGRLEGRIKALRNTIYDANGHRVQLNVVVPVDGSEADKIYRILGNKKPPYAYARKADVLYELMGPNEATDEIKKGREALER